MALSRRVVTAASKRLVQPQQRRYAGHDSHHHHGHTTNESLGPLYWAFVGSIPTIYFLHKYASDPNNAVTTWIKSYDDWQDEYAARNHIQARLLQQAADDKVLFATGAPHFTRRKVELRSLEQINAHSPYNVIPGWRSIDLSELVAEVEKQNLQREKEQLEAHQAALITEVKRDMQTKLEIQLARLKPRQKAELRDQLVEANEKELNEKLNFLQGEE